MHRDILKGDLDLRSKYEHYIIGFCLTNIQLFTIWCGELVPAFITDSTGKLMTFLSVIEIKQFAVNQHGLNISCDDVFSYQIDPITNFITTRPTDFDELVFLNTWNIIDDIAKSTTSKESGNFIEQVEKNLDIYEKLFFARNVFKPNDPREKVIWNKSEIDRLAMVMETGINLLKNSIEKSGSV